VKNIARFCIKAWTNRRHIGSKTPRDRKPKKMQAQQNILPKQSAAVLSLNDHVTTENVHAGYYTKLKE
jgi:hypothetical protein